MRYLDFRNAVQRPMFSGADVDVVRTGVHSQQMNRWVAKGYITRIRRDLFLYADSLQRTDRREVAFRLYEPSYVSLETALVGYGLVPEVVRATTSVSTRTTRTFGTPAGEYIYRHVKRDLFWGYASVQSAHGKFLYAAPEKAVLDYIYFNTHRIRDEEDVHELRLNPFVWKEKIDTKKLLEYAARYNSPPVLRCANLLINALHT